MDNQNTNVEDAEPVAGSVLILVLMDNQNTVKAIAGYIKAYVS